MFYYFETECSETFGEQTSGQKNKPLFLQLRPFFFCVNREPGLNTLDYDILILTTKM